MFIQGRHAALHTSTTRPFITGMDPLSVRPIQLGEKRAREARNVVFTGSMTDRRIQVDTKDLGNGRYGLQPIKPLQPGEEYAAPVVASMPAGYGFWTYSLQNASAARAYDFSFN